MRLTYTYLRTATGARIVIPNERLASGVLRNDTILGEDVASEVLLWLAPAADASRGALAVGQAIEGATATIAEVTPWGTRLTVVGPRGTPPTRLEREAELRAAAYDALRTAGLI